MSREPDLAKLSRWHKKAIIQLKKIGLDVRKVRSKRHIVITGTIEGQPFSWTSSSTPSDKRAYQIEMSNLRRELRRCGVEDERINSVRTAAFLLYGPSIINVFKTILDIEDELKGGSFKFLDSLK